MRGTAKSPPCGVKNSCSYSLFQQLQWRFFVTNLSVPERAAGQSAFILLSPAAKVPEGAGPVVFRILPHEFRAKASAEGPSGNRALS
jgi:hypothetical protein